MSEILNCLNEQLGVFFNVKQQMDRMDRIYIYIYIYILTKIFNIFFKF